MKLRSPPAINVDGKTERSGDLFIGGQRFQRCSAKAMAASICLAYLRCWRGAQSIRRRLSRISPLILCWAYVLSYFLGLARRIETVDRRNETDDTVGYQVIQVYALGQAAVNSAS